MSTKSPKEQFRNLAMRLSRRLKEENIPFTAAAKFIGDGYIIDVECTSPTPPTPDQSVAVDAVVTTI
jgi:hypothetical protein